jgi:membrane protein YdbS with pleckstrin-like domain
MVQMTVKRGPESWSYLYIVLAILIGIEAGIASMLPLPSPWNAAIFVAAVALTTSLILRNFWVQNTLIRFKNWYENKGHTR